tara:strand:- start:2699 stop:3013 length:315 start_codon:yes stop_codon:yes gene_type:complete
MNKEIRKSDIIVFNKKSGCASFVNVLRKGNYFMPAKINMHLNGIKSAISYLEKFVFVNFEILKENAPRILRIELLRINTGETCFISENDMFRYFSLDESVQLDD